MTEYRIDDLAREAGTTTRNVRGYQDRGLLPRPLRRGRIAIYTDTHLSRLKIINDLLGQGFTIRHISDFLRGLQRGDDLVDILGLRDIVAERWSTTRSTTTMSADELTDLLDLQTPEQFQRLVEFELLEPLDTDPTRYRILDQETVAAYGMLIGHGLSITRIIDVHGRLEGAMTDAADTLISAGRRAFVEGRADGWLPATSAESDEAAELLADLRKAGRVSVHNVLDRALDREMRRQLNEYLGKTGTDCEPI